MALGSIHCPIPNTINETKVNDDQKALTFNGSLYGGVEFIYIQPKTINILYRITNSLNTSRVPEKDLK